jgi:hypothetical protein
MTDKRDITETLARFAWEVMGWPEFAPDEAHDTPEYREAVRREWERWAAHNG